MIRLALALLGASSIARADESCQLKMVGDIDFTAADERSGMMIDATLDGVTKKMIIDTGGVATEISEYRRPLLNFEARW